MSKPKFTFKLVLLGDQAVGKTSLVLRFVNHTFSEHYISTIGADFLIKDLELLGAPIRLMIWDLGGQEQWEGVRARYMQGSDGVILVFDVSRKQNIEYYIFNWIKEIKEFIGEKAPLIIVGNKMDLKPQIDLSKTEKFIKDLNYPYVETSAKTGDRVEGMFQRITAGIVVDKAEYIKRIKGLEDTDISDIFTKIRERT
ncbi:MAG: GTP-binding protein [Candidatus Helarchaeota archaeon]|nr:GTP-binding protein [Candidatus Helarchaeota archaeon]